MLGSGQRHLCCESQMALPGQSEFCLHVTTPTHLVNGSGAGIVPSGHWQEKLPGWLTQTAPIPQTSLVLHSLISKVNNWGFSHFLKELHGWHLIWRKNDDLPKHCFNGLPENPGAHLQLNPPGVFVQIELAPHFPEGPCTLSHSSTSVFKERFCKFYTENYANAGLKC